MKIPGFEPQFRNQLDNIEVTEYRDSWVCFKINDQFIEIDLDGKSKLVKISQYVQVTKENDILTNQICTQSGHLGVMTEEQTEVFQCIWFSYAHNIKLWE